MTTVTAFIKRRAVLTYFVLAFVLSWGSALIVVGPGIFLGTTNLSEELTPVLYLAALLGSTLVGPSLSGLLMTGLVYGRAGLRSFLARLFCWRVDVRWYAVALLTAPLAMLAVNLALSLTSPAYLPGILTADDKVSLLLAGLIAGLLIGSFEELGWTGFAIPELRRRYGILTTGLIVGVVWGAWHYPAFSASGSSSGAIMHAFTVAVLLFSFLPPYRVLMVWVYDRTQSLLVAMLMHVSLTASTLIFQSQAVEATAVTSDLVLAAVLWLFVAAVALINHGQIARPPLRGQMA
ncbi:MAG: hypothetical protein DCC55_40685 [Chloroflexi bacterium]|nr:MAG: hypothetical protein DCC55_40685 [Chloroflexota bacterium]